MTTTTPTTYPATVDGLTAALAALGDTAEQVAGTLHRLGHRGTPYCCTTCPVANYLTATYPDTTISVVKEHGVGIAELWNGTPDLVAAVPLPAPVAEFIDRFDRHADFGDLDWTRDRDEATA